MKVTKAQAQANRAHVVETASHLFRERGFDGIGVAELMAAAGFTHGGFYKHFGSKADLMAESTACGIEQTLALSEGADAAAFVRDYLSREHRDDRATGCTLAALGGDAARQPDPVRVAFAEGVEHLVAALSQSRSDASTADAASSAGAAEGVDAADAAQARARILDTMAHAVGAIVLSRACPDDSPLADEILAVSRNAILEAMRPPTVTKAASRRRSTG